MNDFASATIAGQMNNPSENRLLATLPAAERRSVLADLQRVQLVTGSVLCEPGERIRDVYFPIDGFISLITPVPPHSQVEVGLVGSEGMLGVSLALGVGTSPLRGLVQGAGSAWRIDAASFRRLLARSPALQKILNRYLYVILAQLAQTAACTRFHVVEARLARWLLMTRDRGHSSDLTITHEFLAYMLGVRRVGITRAASSLQRRKLIRYARGEVAIIDGRGLEQAACSCYAADRQLYATVFG